MKKLVIRENSFMKIKNFVVNHKSQLSKSNPVIFTISFEQILKVGNLSSVLKVIFAGIELLFPMVVHF